MISIPTIAFSIRGKAIWSSRTKFELPLNFKTVKQTGLFNRESTLFRADDVIK